MGGDFTSGLLFNRPASTDVIRMRVGKNKPRDLPGIPAGLFYIIQNNRLGAGNAAVDEANLIAKD